MVSTMTETLLDPTSLPLQPTAPGSSVRRFTKTFPTQLPPEVLWTEFTRTLTDSHEGVLWANDISWIRALNAPLREGTVLAERMEPTGAVLHYRLMEFSPPKQLRYASLQGHPLAASATVSIEAPEGKATLLWQGEYFGSEAQLLGLDRVHAAFFSQFAARLQQLDATR
ncbi:hypothetical protein D187_004063 [Cystobacter fuscus DSM 2262]|uniref:SRPBCC family protein n=2 Tax=Cystobacter fuscus TaxID=43 RepID=S9P7V5_CYSF2|nr:hypothetical protein D187_004063 [Cystobacter fuscus DSM 2262]